MLILRQENGAKLWSFGLARGFGNGLGPSGAMGKGDFLSCGEAETLIKRVERYIANKPADYAENNRVDYSFFETPKTPEDQSERVQS